MTVKKYEADVAIIGAGIAGVITACEILAKKDGRRVLLVDRDSRENIGGLAKWAFGGMALCGTPHQRRMRIDDNPELMLKDWHSFAEYDDADFWPREWARYYVENCNERIFEWFKGYGLKFLPAVQWVERGLHVPGNSVARYHILWGSSKCMTDVFIARLFELATPENFELVADSRVDELIVGAGAVTGFQGKGELSGRDFTVQAPQVIIATGGVGGNLANVRKNWPQDWIIDGASPPAEMYNGSHPYCDGRMHDAAERIGGNVTHLDWMWNYASGIPHPKPHFQGQGLGLVPTKSSLWLDHTGKRIGPDPLVSAFDTNDLCKQVSRQKKPWTWAVMNWRIACREFAISGAEHNPDVRDRNFIRMVYKMLTSSPSLINQMVDESDQIITAPTLDELVNKMNAITDKPYVNVTQMRQDFDSFNAEIRKGPDNWDDSQLKRIMKLREWGGDKIRTVMPRPLDMKKDMPYVAIRMKLISRKTLGGIQTDLDCRVLDESGAAIKGLYAIGEAAGFGGGGASGRRSLEGTFLSGCVLTARRIAEIL